MSNFKCQISNKKQRNQLEIGNWKLEIPAMQVGFTLPEVTIVTGIFLMLFGFIILNVINSQHHTSVSGDLQILIADMKSQQIKAMVGATEGRATSDVYGIHFGSTNYTLFHGTTYSATDSANFVVSLDQNLQFYNVTFPNANIVFSQGSGEVQGFTNGQNTITIEDSSGSTQKTITVNRFGVITSVN